MLPPPPPNKRQKGKSFLDKYEWTPGLQFDKKWPIDKRRWYTHAFKKNDLAGWKKHRLERLEQERKELTE